MRSLTKRPHKHEEVLLPSESVASSVSGIRGAARRPAADGRVCSVSWAVACPIVTGVVRCDPVVRGPDVAPAVPSLEGASRHSVQPRSYADGAGQVGVQPTAVDRERPPDAGATGTWRARPARANRAPGWRRWSQAKPEGEARPRRPLASLAGPEARGSSLGEGFEPGLRLVRRPRSERWMLCDLRL